MNQHICTVQPQVFWCALDSLTNLPENEWRFPGPEHLLWNRPRLMEINAFCDLNFHLENNF